MRATGPRKVNEKNNADSEDQSPRCSQGVGRPQVRQLTFLLSHTVLKVTSLYMPRGGI